MNFRSHIDYLKIKNNQCRCPECFSETFLSLELKKRDFKFGKYNDYDRYSEESILVFKNRSVTKFSVDIFGEEESYIKPRVRVRMIFSDIKHAINNNKHCQLGIIHCSRCHWYKFIQTNAFYIGI